jgi:hypothetical protein
MQELENTDGEDYKEDQKIDAIINERKETTG